MICIVTLEQALKPKIAFFILLVTVAKPFTLILKIVQIKI